ncbi:MAG: helix-hairpin-helix domain-containing protein [Chitinophagaceae bacterium]
MIEKFIQDYFTFTRSERVAVIALSATLVVIFSLPHFIPAKEPKMSLKEVKALQTLETAMPEASRLERGKYPERAFEREGIAKPVKRFQFDPNTLDVAGWQSLGVRDKTIKTIQNYLEKGGQFRKPEDLAKVYGLTAGQVNELIPFIHLKAHEPPVRVANFFRDSSRRLTSRPARTIAITDIATADSLALVNLPGIGPKLAMRIINFRDKLGGFYAVNQLSETFGLPDSTFMMLRPYLTVTEGKVTKISLNNSSVEVLRSHPYIRWNLANAIIAYRVAHGPFKEISSLNGIALITPEIFTKISPYLEL